MQKKLDDKREKCSAYRAKCDRVWLLVVAAGEDESSFIELAGETRERQFKSPFDRILFMNAMSQNAHELKVGPGQYA